MIVLRHENQYQTKAGLEFPQCRGSLVWKKVVRCVCIELFLEPQRISMKYLSDIFVDRYSGVLFWNGESMSQLCEERLHSHIRHCSVLDRETCQTQNNHNLWYVRGLLVISKTRCVLNI